MHEFNETYFDKCIHTIAAYNVVARDNETDCIEEQASPDVAFSPEVSLVFEVPLQIKNVYIPVPLHVCMCVYIIIHLHDSSSCIIV